MSRLSLLAVLSLSLVIVGCGGGSGSSTPSPLSNLPANSSVKKLLSFDELQQSLPAINNNLNTTSPEGIWVVNSSIKYTNVKNLLTNNSTSYLTGRHIALIIKNNDNTYKTWACGSEYDLDFEDINLALTGNRLSYSRNESVDVGNETTSYDTNWSIDLIDNLSFTSSLNDIETTNSADLSSEVQTRTIRLAAVKLDDAISFEDSTNFTTTFSLIVNSSSFELTGDSANIGERLSCIGAAEGNLTGFYLGESVDQDITIAQAMTKNGQEVLFDISEGRVGSINDESYYFYQDMVTPNVEGFSLCSNDDSNCDEATSGSITISEDTQEKLSFSAEAENDNNDTMSLNVSFSD
ncbi:MAG: hypothetical protein P1U57_10265 [Oleibacter sp.]|nr:hypothetical protein [Thalassolituus sp.]